MKAILALNTELPSDIEMKLLDRRELPVIKHLLGMYKGETEHSYLVECDNQDDIYNVANAYNQESILLFDKVKTNLVYLMNVKTRELMLSGTWVNKGAVMPMNVDAYSFDGNNYYVIE
jgi:hypothetical protein